MIRDEGSITSFFLLQLLLLLLLLLLLTFHAKLPSFIQSRMRLERSGLLGSREQRYSCYIEVLRMSHPEMRRSTNVHIIVLQKDERSNGCLTQNRT